MSSIATTNKNCRATFLRLSLQLKLRWLGTMSTARWNSIILKVAFYKISGLLLQNWGINSTLDIYHRCAQTNTRAGWVRLFKWHTRCYRILLPVKILMSHSSFTLRILIQGEPKWLRARSIKTKKSDESYSDWNCKNLIVEVVLHEAESGLVSSYCFNCNGNNVIQWLNWKKLNLKKNS